MTKDPPFGAVFSMPVLAYMRLEKHIPNSALKRSLSGLLLRSDQSNKLLLLVGVLVILDRLSDFTVSLEVLVEEYLAAADVH